MREPLVLTESQESSMSSVECVDLSLPTNPHANDCKKGK